MANEIRNELLTAQEVASELRCSKTHVYKLMNGQVPGRSILPHLALGRKKVIRRASFEAWLLRNEIGGMLVADSDRNTLGAVQ